MSSGGGESLGFPHDRYRQVIKIGQGQFGSVFKYALKVSLMSQSTVDDFQWPLHVAIKKLKRNGKDDIMQAREEENLRALNHWNVVTFLDVVSIKDRNHMEVEKWLVMDLCDTSLEQFAAERTTMSDQDIASIARQILQATSYMHGKSIIHRDLKCSNILIQYRKKGIKAPNWAVVDIEDIVIKVADFGLSRRPHEGTMTNAGSEVTMAPEVPDGIYDARADVFSIGAIVYEIKTRKVLPEKKSVHKGLDGGMWDQEFSLPLTLFLQATLMADYKKRPTSEALLKHPFITSTDGPLISLANTGGIKAIDCTDEFFLARCFKGNLYIIEPLTFSKADNITHMLDKHEEKNSQVTALSAFQSKFALGFEDGRVQVWEITRNTGESPSYFSLKRIFEETVCKSQSIFNRNEGTKVAWVSLNDEHLICTGENKEAILFNLQKRNRVEKQMTADPSNRACSLILSARKEGNPDSHYTEKGMLTWAEGGKVTQHIISNEKNEDLRQSRHKDSFNVGQDYIIDCIALHPSDPDKVWIAAHPPNIVIRLINLSSNTVLNSFRMRGGCKQILHLGDFLLFHMEDFIAAVKMSDVPVGEDGPIREEGRRAKEQEIGDTGYPRMHNLNNRFIVYVDRKHQLTYKSTDDLKKLLVKP